MNDVVNLAKPPQTGMIVKLMVSQGLNKIERSLTAGRAVYASEAGMTSRMKELATGVVFSVDDPVTALTLKVSGSPVTLTLRRVVDSAVQNTVIVVRKLLVIDDSFGAGFTVQTTGESSFIETHYQN